MLDDGWLINLVMEVTALEDKRYEALANMTFGRQLSAENIATIIRELGAEPSSRRGDQEQTYGLIEEGEASVRVVGVAKATPRNLGLLLHYSYDQDDDAWTSQLQGIAWAEDLLDSTAAQVRTVTVVERPED